MLSLLSFCINEDVFTLCMYIYILHRLQSGHLTHSVTKGHLKNLRDCITQVTLGTEIKNQV